MRTALQVISLVALLGVIVPPILFLAGAMALGAGADGEASSPLTVTTIMLAGTVLWFVVTPFWMERKGE